MPTADNTSAMTAKTVNIVPKTRWPHRDCSIHVSSGMRRHTTNVGFDGLHLGSDDGWRALKIGAPNQQHPGFVRSRSSMRRYIASHWSGAVTFAGGGRSDHFFRKIVVEPLNQLLPKRHRGGERGRAASRNPCRDEARSAERADRNRERRGIGWRQAIQKACRIS